MGTRTGTYYTGTIDGTAGSLITALDAILVTGEGWTKTFSGTNKAVYTQAGGNGFCIRVVDDGSLAAGAREAVVRAGESATDVDTLVDAFPSTALSADAITVWRKSDTADATTRNYRAVADDRTLVFTVRFGTNSYDNYIFGDMEPYFNGDTYATMLLTRGAGNNATAGLCLNNAVSAFDAGGASAAWFARRASGLTKIDRAALMRTCAVFGNTGAGSQADYPHPETTKMHQFPVRVTSFGATVTSVGASAMPRGVVPFMFEPLHGATIASLAVEDTWTDTAYDAASQFQIFSVVNNLAAGNPRWILQTAGTWDVGV